MNPGPWESSPTGGSTTDAALRKIAIPTTTIVPVAGPAVDALLYLLAEAFEGRGLEESDESQALLTNLATVDAATWCARPEGSSPP